RGADAVSRVFEGHLDDVAHIRLILDDEDGLARAVVEPAERFDRSRLRRGRRFGPRQIERDARAGPRRALDRRGAARLPDEAVDLREAEPGSLADILGGEERLEGEALDIGRHAGAGV